MSDENRITVRFSPDEMQNIRRLANAAGLPPSTYVRLLAAHALNDKARDEALRELHQEQQLFLAEVLRRVLQLRLILCNKKSPADALAEAANSVGRLLEKIAGGALTLAELTNEKEQ